MGAKGPVRLSRRSALVLSAASALTAGSSRLFAQSVDVRGRGYDPLWRNAEETIETFLGAGPYAREGLSLVTGDYVDNGSSVPLTIRIASTMTPADHPRVVHVVAHANPNPQVVSVWFTPECGRAEFSTRIRLERSQRITAVAQMSDGRLLRADEDVEIMVGACADDSSGTPQDIAAFVPQSRVSVPATARAATLLSCAQSYLIRWRRDCASTSLKTGCGRGSFPGSRAASTGVRSFARGSTRRCPQIRSFSSTRGRRKAVRSNSTGTTRRTRRSRTGRT